MPRPVKAPRKDMIRRNDAEWLSLKAEYDILPDSMPLIHRIMQAQANSEIPTDRRHSITSHSAALRQLRSMARVAEASRSHVPNFVVPQHLRVMGPNVAPVKEVTQTPPTITIQHGEVGIVAHLMPGEYHLIVK